MPSSVHAVPAALTESAGHVALFPGQFSARSHSFTAERHVNVDGWNTSLGHVLLLPVHVSAASHPPAVARQVVPALPGLWTHSGEATLPLH